MSRDGVSREGSTRAVPANRDPHGVSHESEDQLDVDVGTEGPVRDAGFEDADPQVPEFGVALGQVSEALVPDEVFDLVW
ncbi:hypothetical protein QV65_05295 [Rhodococcus erythropolis]|nr:hypothetical protein QV65_05295 [Rhodococcus erythropolis]